MNFLTRSIYEFQFAEDAYDYARRMALDVSDSIRFGSLPAKAWDDFDAELSEFIEQMRMYLPSRVRGGKGGAIAPPPIAVRRPALNSAPPPIATVNSLLARRAGFAISGLDPAQQERPAKLPLENTFGEIEAFRVWRVFDHLPQLFSSYTYHQWGVGEVMKAHKKPEDNDDDILSFERTGIHAWKSMVEVVEHGKSISLSGEIRKCKHRALAFGRVKLWGEVVEHQRGYRAEFARVEGIDDLVEIEVERYRDHSRKVDAEYAKSRWLGEDLARIQERYFPDRKRKV